MCLYDASFDTHFGFCCDIDEEITSQLACKLLFIPFLCDNLRSKNNCSKFHICFCPKCYKVAANKNLRFNASFLNEFDFYAHIFARFTWGIIC